MLNLIIAFVVGALAGFAAGFFIYHNNKEKASIVADKIETAKDKVIKN